jgi:23S rRNA (uracil1939-C5)-methyltransferase
MTPSQPTELAPLAAPAAPQDQAQPPCPHFGPCGGCQLQHLTYAAQLTRKADRLRQLLTAPIEENRHSEQSAQREVEEPRQTLLSPNQSHLPANHLPELQLHPSPPLAYRNRIRLTLADRNGQLRAGYLTSPTPSQQPEFLPITQCPIAAPILWHAAEALVALLQQRRSLWIERAPFTLDQLELFTTADQAQLQLSLILRTSARNLPKRLTTDFAALCESLRSQLPELLGAGILLLPPRSARSRRVEQPRPGPTWNNPGLTYTVPLEPRTPNPEPALTYWVPRGAFFQVNRFLLPELLALVANNRAGNLAWDLYAGVGLFTKALAASFDRVIAVEIAEPSFTALTSNKLANRQAVKDTTLDFLRRAVTDRERPDLIVLDPPRTGAGREVCELLARIAAPTVVYVSCSPETLPADLATLTASGYRVAELHLLDLFPQTTHIETVAVLTRS